jgi:O-antigen/teichoic acid export membrane protein
LGFSFFRSLLNTLDPNQQHRRQALWLAIATSILSKGGNMLLMLLAFPLAIKMLGPERSAVYAVIQSIGWVIAISDLGIGPGLSRRIAVANAAGDRSEMGRIVSVAFFTVLAFSGCLAVTAFAVLETVPLARIFGAGFAPYAAEMTTSIRIAIPIFAGLILLYLLERIREGLQEVHMTNAFGAAGNLSAAGILWFGLALWPTVPFLILAIYGITALFLLGNILMIFRKRPWLLPRLSAVNLPLMRSLATEGLGLFIAGSVAPMIIRETPKLMAGQFVGPMASNVAAILVQLGFFGFGLISMVTRPLWGASADAHARHDHAWVRAFHRKIYRWFLPGSLAVLLGFSLIGPTFTDLWLRDHPPIPRLEFLLSGMIFCLMIWAHLHYIMLGSTGRIREAAWIMGLEAFVVIAFVAIGFRMRPVVDEWQGLPSGLIGSVLASLLVSAWMLPRALRRSESIPILSAPVPA